MHGTRGDSEHACMDILPVFYNHAVLNSGMHACSIFYMGNPEECPTLAPWTNVPRVTLLMQSSMAAWSCLILAWPSVDYL